MNGTQEALAGAPLAAHFETKRRIWVTLKQMEKRGEKLQEATPEEIVQAALKSDETVFKFDFRVSDEAQSIETSSKKRNRNRKRRSKRRHKKKLDKRDIESENVTRDEILAAAVPMMSMATAKDKRHKSLASKQPKENVTGETFATSSFLKLRKATGTESEVAKMHLRYGQGRRNLPAMKQREQRLKMTDAHAMEAAALCNDFKFNFAT